MAPYSYTELRTVYLPWTVDASWCLPIKPWASIIFYELPAVRIFCHDAYKSPLCHLYSLHFNFHLESKMIWHLAMARHSCLPILTDFDIFRTVDDQLTSDKVCKNRNSIFPAAGLSETSDCVSKFVWPSICQLPAKSITGPSSLIPTLAKENG